MEKFNGVVLGNYLPPRANTMGRSKNNSFQGSEHIQVLLAQSRNHRLEL